MLNGDCTWSMQVCIIVWTYVLHYLQYVMFHSLLLVGIGQNDGLFEVVS